MALAQSLVRWAARRAPGELAARLEEEWLADLAGRSSAPGRLGFALGCCWAGRVIALEHLASGGATAMSAASAAQRTISLHLPSQDSVASRRTLVALVILALHVAIILAFAAGLGRVVIRALPPSITVPFVQEQHPRLPDPVVIPEYDPSKLRVAASDVPRLPQIPDPEPAGVEWAESAPLPPIAQPPAGAVTRLPGGPGKGFPNTEDFYPPGALRDSIGGSATVRVCVDAAGRLTGAPELLASAGDRRLDEAARRLSVAGSGHYRPTTENGRALSACFPFRVTFAIRR